MWVNKAVFLMAKTLSMVAQNALGCDLWGPQKKNFPGEPPTPPVEGGSSIPTAVYPTREDRCFAPFDLIYFLLSEFLSPCTLNFLNNTAYRLGVWDEDTVKR